MLLVTKQTEAEVKANFLMPVMFLPCVGARDVQTAAGLDKAFTSSSLNKVKSIHRNDSPNTSCWFAGNGWWLSTERNALRPSRHLRSHTL
jgi:protein-L-isoaspartate(D-aspartate) O-methyltransferase